MSRPDDDARFPHSDLSKDATLTGTPTKQITIYTDGACLGNPGPGGYGVVLMYREHRREISGGYRLTTNNRMELMAVIVALEALTEVCDVTLFSDSQYVINGIEKGWAKKWASQGWMRNKTDAAVNPDLWAKLLDLCDYHRVFFRWVRGHNGDKENERCDYLATTAAKQPGLPIDTVYERVPA
jgi:ribonuclease HI